MIAHSQPCIGDQEIKAVAEVLRSGMLIGGNPSRVFRGALGHLVGNGRDVSLFASGRLAILEALRAIELPTGSSIIVQSYVCNAVLWAIREAGHHIVLCDIGDGWTAGVEQMKSVFTPDCRAIILAPPFGFMQTAADFREFGVPIIHDLCQSSPNLLAESKPAALGDIVCLSFHPTKYLCGGGGGAAIDMTGQYGKNLRLHEDISQKVSSFTEIHAALASVQLARIDEFEARRAETYDLYIASAPELLTVRLRNEIDVHPGAMFRFPLDIEGSEAADIFPVLAKEGIIARHGVDQPAHRSLGLDDGQFPNTIRAFHNTISPPFYPALIDSDVRFVAEKIAVLQ